MHTPVLLEESLDLLDLQEGDIYLDATLGQAGHALEVWRRWGDKVEILGIDADPQAIAMSKERLEQAGAAPKLKTLNFRDIDHVPDLLGTKPPTKILFDLGWNKSQFDDSSDGGGRGFSFQKDEPLLMTFGDPKESREFPFNAYDIVNMWDEESIETVISAYGEERFAKRITKKIIEERAKKEIKTSLELGEIIKSAVPVRYRFGRIHPATKTFQALRITVNDELRTLQEGLKDAYNILAPEGRVAVISFHSLEDRIVKRFFKNLEHSGQATILTKKPLEASEEEIDKNPRSRSAKLRAIIKIK